MIKLAYENPNLKVGDKVYILTNEEHKELGTSSKTSAWGLEAQQDLCYRAYTVTERAREAILNQKLVSMEWFPECPHSKRYWTQDYRDFRYIETKIIEVPMYQILQIKNEDIQSILLTYDEKTANKLLALKTETNKDPETKYKLITFKLNKKVQE